MPSADKLDCLQISHVYVVNYLNFCSVKSFIFPATELYYHATIITSCKQHFKCILTLAANGKRVVKYI